MEPSGSGRTLESVGNRRLPADGAIERALRERVASARPARRPGPIGDEYERLVRGGMLVLQLHRFDVEHHHGRIAARILALTAAIHLNWQLGLPPRGLTAYGH
jgi:hypothetical protein